MGRFYSIPGVSGGGRRLRPLLETMGEDPRLREWLASRPVTSHRTVGMEGEKVGFRGDPALVHHEEHDTHSGRVEQVVQRSDQTSSGTYVNRWVPGDSPRTMVLAESRRTFD